jgi:nucleotide-binding universal stress UspA family protein
MSIKKIIAGTDFSDESTAALAHAVAIAKQQGAELHLVHAVQPIELTPPYPPYPIGAASLYAEQNQEIQENARKLLDAEAERLEASGVRVNQSLSTDLPARSLVDAAEELEADLIVVGTHGRRGLSRFLLGSVAQHVVQRAHCDVLVTRGKAPEGGRFNRVLVPTDFSASASAALEQAFELCKDTGKIELFHCWQVPASVGDDWTDMRTEFEQRVRTGSEELAAQSMSHFADKPATLSFHLKEGDARHSIQDQLASADYDLVVMGSHGRTGLRRLFLGSVAEATVKHSKVPVYVARSAKSEQDE